MTSETLTELANRYGTDKGTTGPSPEWGARNYTDIYSAYLEHDRLAPLTILEIGLGVVGNRWDAMIVHGRNSGGASLKMWHDYFPNSRIYGIDVNACPYLDNDRIRTYVADQGNAEDLESFMRSVGQPEFDVIIDDGSHRPDHQQISLSFFFPKLKRGGIYFIEDLLANGLGDGATGRLACDTVISTRKVLKHFREHGEFPEPNALTDIGNLAENISNVAFHTPEIGVEITQTPSTPPTIKAIMRFDLDRPRLCAIRKS